MSLKSSPQTLHSLEVGDTVFILNNVDDGAFVQSTLVIDSIFDGGWVGGQASYLYTNEETGEIEESGPEHAEWCATDNDYDYFRVYMVVTKDQQVLCVEPGKSIYCGVKEENATE
ncbi:hypothetical protein KNU84_gp079 [Bacteriophage DSS3_VP1]|uniref:Uncharacterized protein n=1 Tax=Bacteriophage DSS3_VP1 TaxID=2664196 RepID=A0A7S5FTF1_9CAUD|nr:hypothetical protein KNU84_gp079 [Bacteriophage DSS3_VP1]QGH74625.1 hypothetical protein DSS3VP1_00057 [Bacteriophage DSS3_VP1]